MGQLQQGWPRHTTRIMTLKLPKGQILASPHVDNNLGRRNLKIWFQAWYYWRAGSQRVNQSHPNNVWAGHWKELGVKFSKWCGTGSWYCRSSGSGLLRCILGSPKWFHCLVRQPIFWIKKDIHFSSNAKGQSSVSQRIDGLSCAWLLWNACQKQK